MILAYIVFGLILIKTIVEIKNAIIAKKYTQLSSTLFFLPFFVFFISTLILGGSAFNNAATDYELYQAGHYYLDSHGVYTEVSYASYLYAKIIEVIGLVSFGIGFIFHLVFAKKNPPSKSNSKFPSKLL